MFRDIDTVSRLWRGEEITFPGPKGEVTRSTLPRPVQSELPVWVTSAGNPETYRMAGQAGANVLTHLLGQSVQEVADKIRIYREARAAAGHDPAAGIVTLIACPPSSRRVAGARSYASSRPPPLFPS